MSYEALSESSRVSASPQALPVHSVGSVAASYVTSAAGSVSVLHATAPFLQTALHTAQQVCQELKLSFALAAARAATERADAERGEATQRGRSESTLQDYEDDRRSALVDDGVLLDHFSTPVDVFAHGTDWCFLHDDPPSTYSEWLRIQTARPSTSSAKMTKEGWGLRCRVVDNIHGQMCGILRSWLMSCARWSPTSTRRLVPLHGDAIERKTASASAIESHPHQVDAYIPYISLQVRSFDDWGVSFRAASAHTSTLRTHRLLCGQGEACIVLRHTALRACRNLFFVAPHRAVEDDRLDDQSMLPLIDQCSGMGVFARGQDEDTLHLARSMRVSEVLLQSPWQFTRAVGPDQPHQPTPSFADDVWSAGILVLVTALRLLCSNGGDGALMGDPVLVHIATDGWVPEETSVTRLSGLYRWVEGLRRALLVVTDERGGADAKTDEREQPTSHGSLAQCLIGVPSRAQKGSAGGVDVGVLRQLCDMLHPCPKQRIRLFTTAHNIPAWMARRLSGDASVQVPHGVPMVRSSALPSPERLLAFPQSPFSLMLTTYDGWCSALSQQALFENGASSGPGAVLQRSSALWVGWLEMMWTLSKLMKHHSKGDETTPTGDFGDASSRRSTLQRQELSVALLQSLPSLFLLSAEVGGGGTIDSPYPPPSAPYPPSAPTTTSSPTVIAETMLCHIAGDAERFLTTAMQGHLLRSSSSSAPDVLSPQGGGGALHISIPTVVLLHLWQRQGAIGGPTNSAGGGENVASSTSNEGSSNAASPLASPLLDIRHHNDDTAVRRTLAIRPVLPILGGAWYARGTSALDPLIGGGGAHRRRHRSSSPGQEDGQTGHQAERRLLRFEADAVDVTHAHQLRNLLNDVDRAYGIMHQQSSLPQHTDDNFLNHLKTIYAANRRIRDLVVTQFKSPKHRTDSCTAAPRIPAHLRGAVWRALLLSAASAEIPQGGGRGRGTATRTPPEAVPAVLPASALECFYRSVDVDTPTCNDRQIAVDIPRCHQYDPFLSSPEGHRKILRVVKAWLALHPTMIYWQGVDSVVATLLSATNGDEPTSLLLLTQLLRRWVPHFFLKGNQGAMEHRLLQLSLLLRYYDPQLALHVFDRLECKPELFAISWFLTIFAHVLTIRKCLIVWDFVFASGNPEATVCLACAVMLEMRERLMLATDFATVVSLLSGSFASIDVLHLIDEASVLVACTPPSVLQPALNDPVVSSLVRTSCCSLMHPSDLLSLLQLGSDDGDGWASHGGVLLVDVRTEHERHRPAAAAGGVQHELITVLGAVEVPFDTLHGWGERSHHGENLTAASDGEAAAGGDEGDHHHAADEDDDVNGPPMDGEPVLKLLGHRHMLWYQPSSNASPSVASPPAGAAAIASSPHIVIITDKEPEDGQSAVESLQRLGLGKVSMLLGGIRMLEGLAPCMVVRAIDREKHTLR